MKRHTKQDEKQKTGSYYTTKADELLVGLENIVSDANVIEPFAGGGDLTRWCKKHGANTVIERDLIWGHDSILNPDFANADTVITNPPYLSKNKNKDKTPYNKWKQSDLYKCHMASLVSSDIEKGILILPSNFISESNSKIRDLFFSRFRLDHVKYYRYPIFDDATTGICVIAFSRWTPSNTMLVKIDTHYPDRIVSDEYELRSEYGWLPGVEFFQYIYDDPHPLKMNILREGRGTNILISLLTNGKYPLGAHYNNGDTFYASEKTFTTYQIKLDLNISENVQKNVIVQYNQKLSYYMNKYQGLFLANYMGANQKIKSRRYSNLLLSRCIKENLQNPLKTLFK